MAYALSSRLLRAVKQSGLPYQEVSGWKSRGRGTMGSIKTITAHHTATPRTYSKGVDYPTMNVVKNGRPGLPGPLAQIGLGRSGKVYLIASGIASHAGKSLHSSQTNSHAIGIEAEGAMEAWPRKQHDAYAKLCAALANEFNLTTSRVLGHKETASPKGRKIDPSFNMAEFRKKVNQYRGEVAKAPAAKSSQQEREEDDMKRIGYGVRSKDVTLQPGRRVRVPANDNGVMRLATIKQKETSLVGNVNFDVTGLAEGADLSVNAVVALHDSKKKHTRIVYRYPVVDLVGKKGNGKLRQQYTFVDGRTGYGPEGGAEATIQMEFENKSKAPVQLTWMKHDVIANKG